MLVKYFIKAISSISIVLVDKNVDKIFYFAKPIRDEGIKSIVRCYWFAMTNQSMAEYVNSISAIHLNEVVASILSNTPPFERFHGCLNACIATMLNIS